MLLRTLLHDFKDLFAWSYKELKRFPRQFVNQIELMVNAKPIKQRQYKINPNYVLKVKEDLDKLLDTWFIYPIEITQLFSPLVIVPKKNDKLKICVNYHKLNAQTKKDSFPLSFLDSILDTIASHDMYSFMYGYSGYNRVKWQKKIKRRLFSYKNGKHILII